VLRRDVAASERRGVSPPWLSARSERGHLDPASLWCPADRPWLRPIALCFHLLEINNRFDSFSSHPAFYHSEIVYVEFLGIAMDGRSAFWGSTVIGLLLVALGVISLFLSSPRNVN
jgi:hypothetical protein